MNLAHLYLRCIVASPGINARALTYSSSIMRSAPQFGVAQQRCPFSEDDRYSKCSSSLGRGLFGARQPIC
jgi:hypothetical protein